MSLDWRGSPLPASRFNKTIPPPQNFALLNTPRNDRSRRDFVSRWESKPLPQRPSRSSRQHNPRTGHTVGAVVNASSTSTPAMHSQVDPFHIANQQSQTPTKHTGIKEYEVDDSPVLQRWPTEPKLLRSSGWLEVLYALGDIILVACPLAFIALLVIAARLDGAPVVPNSLGSATEKAMSFGPTIFPILFAALMSRALKILATFWAERGASLGNLELLLASQTVWGTFESQFLMRRLSVVGAHLLLLWTLSPLGGQASLRLLDKNLAMSTSETKLRYLSTGKASWRKSVFMTQAGEAQYAAMNSIYVASLLAPQSFEPHVRDAWANPRIPFAEALDSSAANESGWLDVPNITNPEDYSSLVGIPIVGLQEAKSEFSLETSYFSLSCNDPKKVSLCDHSWTTNLRQVWKGHTNMCGNNITPFLVPIPDTVPLGSGSEELVKPVSYFLDTDLPLDNDARMDALLGVSVPQSAKADKTFDETRTIIFGSRLPLTMGTALMLSTCQITQPRIEVKVICEAKTECKVTQMRPSQKDHRPARFTPLDVEEITMNLFMDIPLASGTQGGGISSPDEGFIKDCNHSPYTSSATFILYYLNLMTVTAEQLSKRLGILLNTYYLASMTPWAFAGGLPSNLTLYGPDNITDLWDHSPPSAADWAAYNSAPMLAETTYAKSSTSKEIYACNYLWLAILAVSSSILFLAGLSGLIMQRITLAPDILGYVSSMTLNNPHVRLPEGGGSLDGMGRARFLKDLKVRIADVSGDTDVGRVAFVSLDEAWEDDGQVRKLEKRRRYI